MRSASDIEQAMQSHGNAVWRACALYLPASEAEDAFQETFLKYALHNGAFNDAEHVKAWLLRVAVNVCKDVLKAARTKNASLDAELELRGDSFAGPSGDERGLHEVLSAFDSLDDPPKTPAYLALYEGYSAPEIARMMDVPEGTVYSWISRARAQLKEALA